MGEEGDGEEEEEGQGVAEAWHGDDRVLLWL